MSVYKLLSENTAEEKIIARKQALAEGVYAQCETGAEGGLNAAMLQELFAPL